MVKDISLISANLASIVIESALYGVFLLLSALSVYAILKTDGRSAPQYGHNSSSGLVTFASFRRTIKRPLFIGGLAMIGTVTGHWVCSSIRLFLAVLHYKDPTDLYSKFDHPTEPVKVAHQMASLVLGDSIMIYRLWVVCNGKLPIIVFPLLTNIGLAGETLLIRQVLVMQTQTSLWRWPNLPARCLQRGTLYMLVKAVSGSQQKLFSPSVVSVGSFSIIKARVHLPAHSIHRLAYLEPEKRSIAIVGDWRIDPPHSKYLQLLTSLMLTSWLQKAFTVFVESAALYTIWTIIFLASYETKTPLHYFMANCHAVVAGISVMSIKTRMFFSLQNTGSRKTFSSTSATDPSRRYPAPDEDIYDTRDEYSLRSIPPVAVKISRIVEREDPKVSSKRDIFDP
ncbi:hypothetical protein PM082_014994 [Marasmius tenuissimus]|nr:hypothetical protein PM082_014994 [Marasmius tenuissimus]